MRANLMAFAAYLAVAIVFTLPTSLSPAGALLGDGADNSQHAWFLWQFARAVASGHNPFYTDLIFYPFGANLAWSTTDPLAGVLALPLSLTAGPVVAYNLSIVLQLALSAFFARLLCLRVSGNPAAAALGGMAFGFSPVMLAQALGHLSLVTAFPVPLYALALGKLLDKEQPSWKEGAFLGLCLVLTALANYNYSVFCLMFTAVILATDLALDGARSVKRLWKPFAWSAVTFLVGFAPLLVMLVDDPAGIPRPRPPEHVARYSADLLGFFLPSWFHWLLGPHVRRMNPALFVAGYEGNVYVGLVVLFLAFLGFVSARGRQRRWAIRAVSAAALFFLLSLGPQVRVWGKPTGFPAPAGLLYKLPFARFVSAPARFHIMTALCLSLLASLGLASLLSRLKQRWRRVSLVCFLAGAMAVEYLAVPFPHSSILDPAPSWDSGTSGAGQGCSLPAGIQGCTVLTLPLFDSRYCNKAMWAQLLSNGRYRLVDGYVSYMPDREWEEFYRMPILRSVLALQGSTGSPVNAPSDRQNAAAFATSLNLCAVAVFRSPHSEPTLQYVQEVFGGERSEESGCTVFEIPRAKLPAKPH